MKTLLLILLTCTLACAQEEFSIKHIRMGTNNGVATGDVILKYDSIISIYISGTERNTFIQDTISKNKIRHLNENWYKSKSQDYYIALYKNPKLYKVGIYIPKSNSTYWIEN